MDELEQFYDKLDKSDYDCRSKSEINSELQQVSTILNENEDFENLKISDIERQAFSIVKSFDKTQNDDDGTINGLSWTMSGTQTYEDGSVGPLYWPDVRNLKTEDFEYFENRYTNCKNLYAKTEFGLLVYFGNKTRYSKHNDFKKDLFTHLFKLSQEYLDKAKDSDNKNHYILHYFTTLQTAFKIAVKSKLKNEIEIDLIVKSVYETHQNWDITMNGSLRALLDLSNLMSEHYKIFKSKVDYDKVLIQNIKGANEQEKTHVWGAIYITDTNIEIRNKESKDIDDLIQYKAELYEKLSIDAEKNGNMACVTFTENALRLYQQIKDTNKIIELEKLYTKQRGNFKLSEIRQELPKEYTDNISKNIKNVIKTNSDLEILHHFIFTPWFYKIETIKKMAEESKKNSALMSFFGSSILDKYGNTVDTFYTEEEKDKFNFWQSYGYNFQIGSQTMHQFFIEAYKSNKISYQIIINYLETTWFNEVIERNYNGHLIEIKPIDLIKPGIKRIFIELDSFFKDDTYQVDYVTITDSLVLKVETIIRNFCEKLGIATFKTRVKGKDKLVMEKLLDDLLADVKHSEINPTGFDEEDRIFIKYVLTEKAGLNLRNQVAHGLIDIYEYSFANILIILSIILKLSKYSFVKK